MRTHMMHMLKAQNSLGTPAGESYRTWRAYRPRQLAREGGGSAAARLTRVREYHGLDQHAEGRALEHGPYIARCPSFRIATLVFSSSDREVGFEKY